MGNSEGLQSTERPGIFSVGQGLRHLVHELFEAVVCIEVATGVTLDDWSAKQL